ncbi:hypothetical protein CPB85DRAFT_1257849 [Mucidula mucida]|nr:hypothetical protein CPB85DRAFT_1257846 [Mucidula mucida]KAF8891166.1 hypothetical protein CPB85DRAFT_1257849 [Mucidula mucida]
MTAFMDTFPALVIFFRFDNLNSPAPLLLLQPYSERKERYGPKEYLKIIAYKQLGLGSVGDAGWSKEHKVEVYWHLRGAGVSGIPSLLLYRKGVNANLHALLLSDAGHPLGCQMDSNKKVNLSPEAGTALKLIPTAMHEANILHCNV